MKFEWIPQPCYACTMCEECYARLDFQENRIIYYNALMDKINISTEYYQGKPYSKVINILARTRFRLPKDYRPDHFPPLPDEDQNKPNLYTYDVNLIHESIDFRKEILVKLFDDYDEEYLFCINKVSILEALVELSYRCEFQIMYDPDYGFHPERWFWIMLKNLGLLAYDDESFNRSEVVKILNRFLNREYESNGKGGLFIVEDSPYDMRNVDIWYQMCYYLQHIVSDE